MVGAKRVRKVAGTHSDPPHLRRGAAHPRETPPTTEHGATLSPRNSNQHAQSPPRTPTQATEGALTGTFCGDAEKGETCQLICDAISGVTTSLITESGGPVVRS